MDSVKASVHSTSVLTKLSRGCEFREKAKITILALYRIKFSPELLLIVHGASFRIR